ncbi:MAG: hypothetical protein ACYC27_19160 [Armatimonadota bacterium]
MSLKTDRVRTLVHKALASVPAPDANDVIRQVAAVIETSHMREYDDLCHILGRDVVNNWIGRWTSREVGRAAVRQVTATGVTIIGSYSELECI